MMRPEELANSYGLPVGEGQKRSHEEMRAASAERIIARILKGYRQRWTPIQARRRQGRRPAKGARLRYRPAQPSGNSKEERCREHETPRSPIL